MAGRIGPNAFGVTSIGTQIWMTRNLTVSQYRNGDIIPQVTDPTAWAALTTGAWCYYNNDPANGPIYGKLYNWYAVNDSRGLAPNGYHIPTTTEWTTLIDTLGGLSLAGGDLKETGTTHWSDPNTGATNNSGFTGLPGGNRSDAGTFVNINNIGWWWTSTIFGIYARYRNLIYNDILVGSAYTFKANGFSVRCIKD